VKLEPQFWTTVIGSFPHKEADPALLHRLATTLDIPAWPQWVRRTFYENMYVQYSAPLPGVVVDEANEKITFDTTGDLTDDLEMFYANYLEDDVDAFALTPEYAAGFFGLLEALQSTSGGEWVKGQVTGPISVGLTVTDQDLRASLYDEMLADAIVKNTAMNARWQVQQLRTVRPNVIIFVDEPYMASFGSAYISLSREQVVAMLDEVFAAIHQEGALAGTHCCANTDWSVLLATTVDILNLDAYGYLDNLALYPEEVRAFLDRGGVIAWGIVPNTEEIFEVTPEDLAQRLRQGLALIQEKAQARGVKITTQELAARSLITPACGLGPTTVDVAERALDVLQKLGEVLVLE
jgi:methionine synthase II (cobalamin-independent)